MVLTQKIYVSTLIRKKEDEIMSALAATRADGNNTIEDRQFKVHTLDGEFQIHKEAFTKWDVT